MRARTSWVNRIRKTSHDKEAYWIKLKYLRKEASKNVIAMEVWRLKRHAYQVIYNMSVNVRILPFINTCGHGSPSQKIVLFAWRSCGCVLDCGYAHGARSRLFAFCAPSTDYLSDLYPCACALYVLCASSSSNGCGHEGDHPRGAELRRLALHCLLAW